MDGIGMIVPIIGISLVGGIAYIFFMAMKKQIDVRMKKKDEKKE